MNSVIDAAYLTAHEYPGGVPALAVRMKAKSAAVLSHKLNPNNSDNHLSLTDLMTMMAMTNDHRVLHAMCMELGYMALPLPTVEDETTAEAIVETCEKFADYLKSVTTTMADNKVTKTELRNVRKNLGTMVAQAGKLEAILAAIESKGAHR